MASSDVILVNVGDVAVDSGSLYVVDPVYIPKDLTDLPQLVQNKLATELSTGGDGSFTVYAVYDRNQRHNLPKEYRIVIDGDTADTYDKYAVTQQQADASLIILSPDNMIYLPKPTFLLRREKGLQSLSH